MATWQIVQRRAPTWDALPVLCAASVIIAMMGDGLWYFWEEELYVQGKNSFFSPSVAHHLGTLLVAVVPALLGLTVRLGLPLRPSAFEATLPVSDGDILRGKCSALWLGVMIPLGLAALTILLFQLVALRPEWTPGTVLAALVAAVVVSAWVWVIHLTGRPRESGAQTGAGQVSTTGPQTAGPAAIAEDLGVRLLGPTRWMLARSTALRTPVALIAAAALVASVLLRHDKLANWAAAVVGISMVIVEGGVRRHATVAVLPIGRLRYLAWLLLPGLCLIAACASIRLSLGLDAPPLGAALAWALGASIGMRNVARPATGPLRRVRRAIIAVLYVAMVVGLVGALGKRTDYWMAAYGGWGSAAAAAAIALAPLGWQLKHLDPPAQ